MIDLKTLQASVHDCVDVVEYYMYIYLMFLCFSKPAVVIDWSYDASPQ